MKADLESYRDEIDRIDREMARLFEQRMAAVASVADWKSAQNQSVFQPERERQVLANAGAAIADPVIRSYHQSVMKTILEVSKAFQQERISGDRRDDKT